MAATRTPCRVLISAGPTHEPIDAVRYLANRSSGRMGLALADTAVRRRLPTTLLLGPTPLDPPDHSGLQVRRFQTTAELRSQLGELWPSHDVLFMAAAVADYRPTGPLATGKIARGPESLRLTLEPTPDLLAELAAQRSPQQIIVGFALEHPDRLLERAKSKLDAKHLDAIVANPLATLEAERITATVLLRGGGTLEPPPDLTKAAFADWLLDQLEVIRTSRGVRTLGGSERQ